MTSKENKFEILAGNLKESLDDYQKLVTNLSKNGMKRVLLNIANHPVEKSVELVGPDEKRAAALGQLIEQTKTHMAIEMLRTEGEKVINKEFVK